MRSWDKAEGNFCPVDIVPRPRFKKFGESQSHGSSLSLMTMLMVPASYGLAMAPSGIVFT